MKKILKILKDKRGVTLMELIVGMVISVIIATYVSAFVAPMLRVFNRSNDLAEVNSLMDIISEEMLNDFSRAKAIKINNAEGTVVISTAYGDITYSNLDGEEEVLKRNSDYLFEPKYYKRKTLSVSITEVIDESTHEAESYLLTLTVANHNGTLATRDYAISPLFIFHN